MGRITPSDNSMRKHPMKNKSIKTKMKISFSENKVLYFTESNYYFKGCPENCPRGKLPPGQGQGLV